MFYHRKMRRRVHCLTVLRNDEARHRGGEMGTLRLKCLVCVPLDSSPDVICSLDWIIDSLRQFLWSWCVGRPGHVEKVSKTCARFRCSRLCGCPAPPTWPRQRRIVGPLSHCIANLEDSDQIWSIVGSRPRWYGMRLPSL